MVYIDVIKDGSLITLNCHKETDDGDFFSVGDRRESNASVKKTRKSRH